MIISCLESIYVHESTRLDFAYPRQELVRSVARFDRHLPASLVGR